jgi:hypothetical protein
VRSTLDLAWVAVAFGTVGGVIAYAIGGAMHIGIDAVHGKRMLRDYWAKTDVKIAAIKADVIGELKVELPPLIRAELAELEFPEIPPFPEIPNVDIGAGLETFLRSEPGRAWALELADVAANKIEARYTGAMGGNKRTDQRRIALSLSTIDWGHPAINVLWAEVVRREPERLNKIAKQIMNSGVIESAVLANGELPEGVSNPADGGKWR